MQLTEKTKIKIVYICAAALIFLAIAGAVVYCTVFTGKAQGVTDAVEFDIALHHVKAAVEVEQERRALELEQKKWDGYAQQLQQRLDARRDSLLILVNPWNEIPSDYKVRLRETELGYEIDVRCADALEEMLSACRQAGGSPRLCSAYRTQEYQQMLYNNKVSRVLATGCGYEAALVEAATAVAVPGTSEHQLGLAADIIDMWYTNLDAWQQYTWTQQWLMENSWHYGFILRYPEGTSEITGIIFEPWHYRYVGTDTAAEVHKLGVTFEEYLEMM